MEHYQEVVIVICRMAPFPTTFSELDAHGMVWYGIYGIFSKSNIWEMYNFHNVCKKVGYAY